MLNNASDKILFDAQLRDIDSCHEPTHADALWPMLRVLLLQHQCPTNALRCSEGPRWKRSSFSSYFFLYRSHRCPPFPETLPKQPSPTAHVLRQQPLGSRVASKSIDQHKPNYHFLADLQDLPPLPSHMSRISIRYLALPSSSIPQPR